MELIVRISNKEGYNLRYRILLNYRNDRNPDLCKAFSKITFSIGHNYFSKGNNSYQNFYKSISNFKSKFDNEKFV